VSAALVRVVVVDDSPAVREALCAVLVEDGRIDVVGTAGDGLEAIEQARTLHPDVLTIDVGMPALDGISAIDVIMEQSPTRIVVVASVDDAHRDDLCFRAIGAGALELVAKPDNRDLADFESWGARLRQTVCLMAEVPVIRRSSGHIPIDPPRPRVPLPAHPHPVEAFGIVASTGGPSALARILGALPPALPFPVLVVQHITEGFAAGLGRWLSSVCPLPVALARDAAPCLPGHVYLAPDAHHLEVVCAAGGPLRARLVHDDHGHVPSGDRLLHSLARALGARAGAVVLTGMGEDGAGGLLAVRKAGGIAWAQDEATSTVYGMPRAALELGGATDVLPLDCIAASINACRGPSKPTDTWR
jgi:two-component system chemotaxis response regulator CheB